MSVQNSIDRIISAVTKAHQAVEVMGGSTTAPYLIENLEEAVKSIPKGEDLSAELEAQDELISALEEAVANKASGGGGTVEPPNIQPLNVTENGTYTASGDVDGYSPITVGVPEAVLESLSVTENGTYTPSGNIDGYSFVSVAVPEKLPVLQPLTVTENGTYPVPESADGYGTVTVNVQSAGGGSEQEKKLVERTVVNYSNNQLTSIGRYAFYGCSSMQSLSCPNATSVKGNGLMNCTSLTSVDLPKVTQLANYAFQGCSSLTKLDLPELTSIQGAAFSSNSSLVALILRSTKTCSLGNKNSLTGTPIANGTGYVYVPSTLVSSYKAATNWSTYAAQIRAIEDYPEITGG